MRVAAGVVITPAAWMLFILMTFCCTLLAQGRAPYDFYNIAAVCCWSFIVFVFSICAML